MSSSPESATARLARGLTLVIVALGISLAVVIWLLIRQSSRSTLEHLSPQDRQELVEQLIEQSPGLYRWAYFAPRIGYTLVPGKEHQAFGTPVVANELGYRTGSPEKAPGTLRIVFVGDSWTFGMGVERLASYPEQVARLANDHAGIDSPVEAWTLALPGYNTLNELAALWYFFDELEPDIVVLCLSGNDNHSTLSVLPNGSTAGQGLELDFYGDPVQLYYRGRWLDSHRYRERWARNFREIAATEAKLESRGVPLLLFFLARWQPFEAHAHVQSAGLTSPYVVAPRSLTRGRWTNRRWGHGTPEANALYGQMVYQALASASDWQPLSEPHPDVSGTAFFDPPSTEAAQQLDRVFLETTQEFIPTSFVAGDAHEVQAPGPIDLRTGEMGRATSLLVRRPQGARRLVLTIDAIDESRGLYPLELEVHIPAPGGGTRARETIDGAKTFAIEIPDDIEVGQAIDVHLVAGAITSSPSSLAARSLKIRSIVPSS